MIYSQPSVSFEASTAGFDTGLTGTLGVRVTDGVGGTSVARTTSGILEYPAGSGVYTATLTAPATGGQYLVVWDSGGASPQYAAEELTVNTTGSSEVVPSGTALCTLSDVRAFLELPAGDTGRDTLISDAINPVSAAITRYCQREFTPTTNATRIFRLDVGQLKVDLAPYDLRTASTVTLHPEQASPITLTATTQYQLQPLPPSLGVYSSVRLAGNLANLFQSDSARFFGYAQVSISGDWGFASIPTDVRRAAVIAVASAIRRDVPALDLGDVLADPRQMTPDRPINYALPAASLRMLSPFKRNSFA